MSHDAQQDWQDRAATHRFSAGDAVIAHDSSGGKTRGVVTDVSSCHVFSHRVESDDGHSVGFFMPSQLSPADPLPASKREATEQNEHARRKAQPLARGVLDYFGPALLAVAECSRIGNEQHNPGQPLSWAYGKSTDEADALLRHLMDRGTVDSDGIRHSAKVAWRALALLERELEKADPELHARQQALRDAAARGER